MSEGKKIAVWLVTGNYKEYVDIPGGRESFYLMPDGSLRKCVWVEIPQGAEVRVGLSDETGEMASLTYFPKPETE